MPLYDFECSDCGRVSELLVLGEDDSKICPACGSRNMTKLMSATSSMTGKAHQGMPGPGDTTCCGSSPGHASCAGPGSCCGRGGH
ncbi:MAG: zinc ribbon domain-containing protein [Desulfarculaceae bacterium]